jgi:serine/threonine-protein kinase
MFAPGCVLCGRYQIEAEIGTGGSSLVLCARDLMLGQPVAIKILRTDIKTPPDMEARLIREARVIAQLRSEHVVRIFDVGTLDEAPFLVMELLYGSDLGALLARRGKLPPALAVDFILQACDALAEAHARGIVHRDIKPSNLFVTVRPDGPELVKVLDFGISKSPVFGEDVSLTQTASLLGTPTYMAPEQMRSARSADARSDVWGLGTVLYELVEGHRPIAADSFAELVMAVSTQPHAPMVAAPQLAPVIARCLAKAPEERYPNIAALAADLARFTTGPRGLACAARMLGGAPRAPGPRPAPHAPAAPRPRLSARRTAAIAAVVLAIAIPALVIAMRRDRARVRAAEPPAAIAPVGPRASGSAADAVDPPPAPAPVPTRAPVPPPVQPPAAPESPPSTGAAPAAATPAKPAVHRQPRPTAGSGCDPYARPEGC